MKGSRLQWIRLYVIEDLKIKKKPCSCDICSFHAEGFNDSPKTEVQQIRFPFPLPPPPILSPLSKARDHWLHISVPGRWLFNFHTPLGFPETHRDFYPEFFLFFFLSQLFRSLWIQFTTRLFAELRNTQVSIVVQRNFVSHKWQEHVESGDFTFIEKRRSQRKTFSGEMSRLFLIKLSTPPLSVTPPLPPVFHTEPTPDAVQLLCSNNILLYNFQKKKKKGSRCH